MRVLIISDDLLWREELEGHIDTIDGSEVLVAFDPYAGVQACLSATPPDLIVSRMMFTNCRDMPDSVRSEAGALLAGTLKAMMITTTFFLASNRIDNVGARMAERYADRVFKVADTHVIAQAIRTHFA